MEKTIHSGQRLILTVLLLLFSISIRPSLQSNPQTWGNLNFLYRFKNGAILASMQEDYSFAANSIARNPFDNKILHKDEKAKGYYAIKETVDSLFASIDTSQNTEDEQHAARRLNALFELSLNFPETNFLGDLTLEKLLYHKEQYQHIQQRLSSTPPDTTQAARLHTLKYYTKILVDLLQKGIDTRAKAKPLLTNVQSLEPLAKWVDSKIQANTKVIETNVDDQKELSRAQTRLQYLIPDREFEDLLTNTMVYLINNSMQESNALHVARILKALQRIEKNLHDVTTLQFFLPAHNTKELQNRLNKKFGDAITGTQKFGNVEAAYYTAHSNKSQERLESVCAIHTTRDHIKPLLPLMIENLSYYHKKLSLLLPEPPDQSREQAKLSAIN